MRSGTEWNMPAAQRFVGEFPEPAFDQVQPGRGGRGEVQVEPWMRWRSQRLHVGMLVGGVVVQDQVHRKAFGDFAVDGAEELQELLVPVPGQALTRSPARSARPTRRTTSWCRAACSRGSSSAPGPASSAATAGCGPAPAPEDFSSMHSTTALSGGSRYSPTTSTSFSSNSGSLDILNVFTRCGFSPARATTPAAPSPATPRPARPSSGTTSASGPPGGMQRQLHDLVDRLGRDRRLRAAALPDLARAWPAPPRRTASARPRTVAGLTPTLCRDPRIGHPVGGHQQRPRPLHLPMRRRLRPGQNLQRLALTVGHRQCRGGRCTH